MSHPFVSGIHCRECKADYARQWRAQSGGKPGIRSRARKRAELEHQTQADPIRYRHYRGFIVDVDAGTVYGRRGAQLGSLVGGYLRIDRASTDDGHSIGVHRIVWESVNGPVPSGLEINHINGTKTDNRLVNLEAVTRRENVLHAIALGLR